MKIFRKLFYRALDSLADDSNCRQRMMTIEETTFGVVKSEVEKEFGSWTGTLNENKKADILIVTALYNSLKSYEKTRKPYEESFFVFQ